MILVIAGSTVIGVFLGWQFVALWPSSSRRKELLKLGRRMGDQTLQDLGEALGAPVRKGLRITPEVKHKVIRKKFRFHRVDTLVFRVSYAGNDDPRGIREHVEWKIASFFKELRTPRFRYGFVHDSVEGRQK